MRSLFSTAARAWCPSTTTHTARWATSSTAEFLGLEQEEAGYKTFVVKPVLGGGIKRAKGSLQTNFGCIQCEWKDEEEFYLKVNVPKGAKCKVVLPDKTQTYVTGGEYEFTCKNGGYLNE